MIDLRKHVGAKFSAIICNSYCEGTIQKEDGNIYLCQNVCPGASCDNKLGYNYSYVLLDPMINEEGTTGFRNITNFKLLSEPWEIETSKWELNSILVNTICNQKNKKIFFISDYIVIMGKDDYCHPPQTKLEAYKAGWRLQKECKETPSEIKEYTLEDIAKLTGTPVDKIRIKD